MSSIANRINLGSERRRSARIPLNAGSIIGTLLGRVKATLHIGCAECEAMEASYDERLRRRRASGGKSP
jgi:hypothetical protein